MNRTESAEILDLGRVCFVGRATKFGVGQVFFSVECGLQQALYELYVREGAEPFHIDFEEAMRQKFLAHGIEVLGDAHVYATGHREIGTRFEVADSGKDVDVILATIASLIGIVIGELIMIEDAKL